MVVESPLTITPPKAVPTTGLDLTTLTAGRIVEARVTALAGQTATLASRHGPLELDLGSLRAAVGDVLRFEVRSVAGEDGQTTLQLTLTSSGNADAKAAAAPAPAVADPVQQALGRAVAKAVATQSGLAPLYATLAGLASAPPGQVPDTVRALVGQLMGGRLAASGTPTAATVATAFRSSGLFSEARATTAATEGEAGGADLKATLTSLRSALTRWVGSGGAGRTAAAGPDATTARPGGGIAGAGAGMASGLAVRAAYGSATLPARPTSVAPETEGGAARLAAFAYGGAPTTRAPGPTGSAVPPLATGADGTTKSAAPPVPTGTMPSGIPGAATDGTATSRPLGAPQAGPPQPEPSQPGASPLESPRLGAPAETVPSGAPGAGVARPAVTASLVASGSGTPAPGASPPSPSAPGPASGSGATSASPPLAPPSSSAFVAASPSPASGAATGAMPTPAAPSGSPPEAAVGSTVSAGGPAPSAPMASPLPGRAAPATAVSTEGPGSAAGPDGAIRVGTPSAGADAARTSVTGVVSGAGGEPAASMGTASTGAAQAAVGTGATTPTGGTTAPPGAPTMPAAPTAATADDRSPPGPTIPSGGGEAKDAMPIGRATGGPPGAASLGAVASEAAMPVEEGEAMLVAGRAAAARERGVKPPPPPRKGSAPVAQAALPSDSASGDGVEGLGRRALERTEGALQRILLEQYVALDTHGEETNAGATRGNREWTAELPLATSGGTSIVQMTVERDGAWTGGERDARSVGWRVRFALDVEPIGPIHAQIGLSGDHLSVGLWIERPEMAARLAADVGQLTAALADSNVTVEPVRVQSGTPPATRGEAGSPSGHFIDVSL